MRRRRTSQRARTSRSLELFAATTLAAALAAAGAAAGSPAAKPRVTVIGDSVAASLDYVPAARARLGRGLDLRSEAAACRRLVAESCVFRGTKPDTVLELVRARGSALGRLVVIDVGYNDWAAVYDVDRVVRTLRASGVRTVVWVTLRETTANYAQVNARIRSAARRWKRLVVADWNAASGGHGWFRPDGLHLTPDGAMGLARFLRPLVLAELARS